MSLFLPILKISCSFCCASHSSKLLHLEGKHSEQADNSFIQQDVFSRVITALNLNYYNLCL